MKKNFDDIVHSESRALFNYWDTLRNGRATPLRAEVDPRDMICNVRNLFILEDLGNRNIRFRLAGTEIVEALDLELRGMSARAIMADAGRESFIEILDECLREPGFGHLHFSRAGAPTECWEMLVLPLRSDSGRIDRVLGCLHCIEAVDRIGEAVALRFSIDRARITPIVVSNPDNSVHPAGFGEAAAPFLGAEAALETDRQPLTAIQGGREQPAEDSPRKGTAERPYLRLVKDD